MKALGVALGTTLGLLVAGYVLILAVGASVGSWSEEVVGQQAKALLLHFAVVATRGILPVMLGMALLGAVLPAAFASRAGLARAVSALAVAAAVVPTLLPLATGPLPRLRIEGAVNLAASVLGLAAVCALGWWLGVDRRGRRRA